jgi:hypothetical protein
MSDAEAAAEFDVFSAEESPPAEDKAAAPTEASPEPKEDDPFAVP